MICSADNLPPMTVISDGFPEIIRFVFHYCKVDSIMLGLCM